MVTMGTKISLLHLIHNIKKGPVAMGTKLTIKSLLFYKEYMENLTKTCCRGQDLELD